MATDHKFLPTSIAGLEAHGVECGGSRLFQQNFDLLTIQHLRANYHYSQRTSMSAEELRYRVCSPKVIHETLDGETVVVNLDTGTYYSLDQSGQVAWQALASGATLPELVAHLQACFEDVNGAIPEQARRLLSEFLAEGLLEPAAGLLFPGGLPMNPVRSPFSNPTLARYTDMQDLLLLDPVHEVDAAAGWPIAKPTA